MDSSQEESLKDFNKENEFTLFRASEISSFVTTTTLGPNSSFDLSAFENMCISNNEKTERSFEREKPLKKSNRRSSGSRLDLNDLMYLRDKMCQESEQRRVNSATVKLLEERRKKEKEKYIKLQDDIEKLRIDAERRHKEKMDALEKKIQYELKLEDEREQQYVNQRKELAANSRKILEEQEKQLELMRSEIRKLDESFINLEAQFLQILQSCSQEMSVIVEAYTKQHNDVKSFKESCRNSLDGSKVALSKLDALTKSLSRDKNEFETLQKNRIEAQRQADERQKQEEEEARRAVEASIVPTPIVLIQPQHTVAQVINEDSSDSKRQYNNYKQLLINMRNQTKLLEETPGLQQVRFALKLVINNAINLLNEVNKMTLIDGHKKLLMLLTGQRCATTKGDVSVTDHNQAVDWCRLKIAEKLIDRCDKGPSVTFYVAALTIAISQKFPEFADIFKALLYKECPFFIPFKPSKLNNQSNEDFLSSWGFRLNENGTCEDHLYYENRTTKFAGLLAALWITNPKNGEGQSPFGIEDGWKYLTAVLNSPPDTNYLHILGKILEIAGSALHQSYGKQFVKLILFLRDRYLPAVQSSVDEETSAPFNRLRETIMKFFVENRFSEPKGKLGPGYW